MKGFLKGTTSVKLPQSLYVESTEDFDLISAKKAKPIPLYHFSSSDKGWPTADDLVLQDEHFFVKKNKSDHQGNSAHFLSFYLIILSGWVNPVNLLKNLRDKCEELYVHSSLWFWENITDSYFRYTIVITLNMLLLYIIYAEINARDPFKAILLGISCLNGFYYFASFRAVYLTHLDKSVASQYLSPNLRKTRPNEEFEAIRKEDAFLVNVWSPDPFLSTLWKYFSPPQVLVLVSADPQAFLTTLTCAALICASLVTVETFSRDRLLVEKILLAQEQVCQRAFARPKTTSVFCTPGSSGGRPLQRLHSSRRDK
ncbi:uncharacterized protein LOC135146006 [Zophobas morio]|jgi:hypothetical protein|uniref:uncharacterized protein LOC135146006 n=1 Tax=Zophobas morio TaxID=2755281 RepID=UPI0030837A63